MAKEKKAPAVCACGAPLRARAVALGKCKACRDAEHGNGVSASKPPKPAKVPATDGGATRKVSTRAKVETDRAPEFLGDVRVSMSVSHQFLENAWSKLSLELKAVAIAAALEA